MIVKINAFWFSLKQLLRNLWTSSIKISVVDTVFSGVGGHALLSLLKLITSKDIFHRFFLRFQYKHLQIALLPLKSQKDDMKFCKIK